MANEEFKNLLLELALTPFLLHFTTEQNWTKIQQEGLVPQPQENTRLKWYREEFGVHLPGRVIWLGREPAEIFVNKDDCPIVIALPINYEKFGLQENFSESEYQASKRILPEEFLGFFDFTQYQEGRQEERAFVKWLKKMEKKTRVLTQ